jgi:glycosyltransferase involved in cell wall biosynthesis
MIELPPLSENPLVSVIVPSFNQGAFIKSALDSILSQDYRPLEVIVVDGASSDNTVEVLREYDAAPEVWWVSEADSGPVEAVNKGFSLARGEICAIQSSDDFYLPGAIRHAVAGLKSEPGLGLVYGDVVKTDETGAEIYRERIRPFSLECLLARETYVPQPAAFFRLAAVRQLGGWDELIPYVPDTDLWFRIAFHAGVKKIDEFIACSRMHPGQRDTQIGSIYGDYERMLNQSPDIAGASRRLKSAAAAGLHVLSARYNIHRSDWELTKALWKAVILRPRCIFSPALPKHRLVPRYFDIARAIGGIRRSLRRVFNPAR